MIYYKPTVIPNNLIFCDLPEINWLSATNFLNQQLILLNQDIDHLKNNIPETP